MRKNGNRGEARRLRPLAPFQRLCLAPTDDGYRCAEPCNHPGKHDSGMKRKKAS